MKVAAESAARYAVGPIGLAALAVSAMFALRPATHATTPVVIDVSEPPPTVVRIGEIVVEGSPHADELAAQIRGLDFARCGWAAVHITLYVHIRDGLVIDESMKVTCPMAVVEAATYAGDADVMIPLDFETSTASSR
jgi:hypothetical protein